MLSLSGSGLGVFSIEQAQYLFLTDGGGGGPGRVVDQKQHPPRPPPPNREPKETQDLAQGCPLSTTTFPTISSVAPCP